MPENGSQDQLRLGFLTALQVSDGGYVGGLLVTNHYGRPLEFQCTSPVRPNRTQQILYGPTLVPFVLGELIGRTLIEKIGVKPDLVLIESESLFELRNHVDVPLAYIGPADESSGKPTDGRRTDRADRAAEAVDEDAPAEPAAVADGSPPDEPVRLAGQTLRCHSDHGSDRSFLAQRAHLVPDGADLLEPFQRVREALEETLNPGAAR